MAAQLLCVLQRQISTNLPIGLHRAILRDAAVEDRGGVTLGLAAHLLVDWAAGCERERMWLDFSITHPETMPFPGHFLELAQKLVLVDKGHLPAGERDVIYACSQYTQRPGCCRHRAAAHEARELLN